MHLTFAELRDFRALREGATLVPTPVVALALARMPRIDDGYPVHPRLDDVWVHDLSLAQRRIDAVRNCTVQLEGGREWN